MKKLIFFIATILVSNSILSQSYENDIEIIQSVYGKEKRAVVTEFVEVAEGQKNDFWKLYNAYEVERLKIGKVKIEILSAFVNDYGDIQPQDASNFMKRALPVRKASDDLLESFYKKISKNIDPVVGLQFYQIESYLASLIRIQLLEEIYTSKN